MIENMRSLTFDTIQDILDEGAYSNLRINRVLSENKLNAMGKALFTEIVYGTVKRKYTLDFYLEPFVKTRVKVWVRQLLWMSVYQYVYLGEIPNHAITNKAVEIAKGRGGYHNDNVVNGVLRTMMCSDLPDFDEIADPKKRMAIEYSMPKWVIDYWATHYGLEETETILQSFLETTSTAVHANLARTSLDDIIEKLQSEGCDVEKSHDLPCYLHIEGQPIIHSRSFKDGFVSIRDRGSMFVIHIMNVDRHDHVLDACSTPGGKTCHTAEVLISEGQVDTSDVHDHKIGLINFSIKKLRLTNIKAFQHDATKPYDETYGKILVDTPCSGLGVMRHKPEIEYTQSKQHIESLVKLQLEVLESVKNNVKIDGEIIYSTCIIEQLENENVIYTFLKNDKNFEFEPFQHSTAEELVKALQVMPQDFNSDGFFTTKIRREDS